MLDSDAPCAELPVTKIIVSCFLGYIAFNHGYLIFGTSVNQVDDDNNGLNDVYEIKDILAVPLEFLSAQKVMQQFNESFKHLRKKGRQLRSIKKRKKQHWKEFIGGLGQDKNGQDDRYISDSSSSSDTESLNAIPYIFTKNSIQAKATKSEPQIGLQDFDSSFTSKFSKGNPESLQMIFGTEPILSMKRKYKKNKKHSKDLQRTSKKVFHEIKMLFQKGGFYMSNTLNLSDAILVENLMSPSHFNSFILGNSFNSEFMWNAHMLLPFQKLVRGEPEVGKLMVPVIRGFIGASKFNVHMEKDQMSTLPAKLILISRRNIRRPGMRYLRRGVDDDGNVANFVETIQILKVDGKWCSYKILRGSIPVFFHQDPSKLQPAPQIGRNFMQNKDKCAKHFQQLSILYGDNMCCISLVDKQSKERRIGLLYQRLANSLKIPFVWFDFHAVCSKMRYDKISLLMEDPIVSSNFHSQSYRSSNGSIQEGIFRINCIDCLDRTNIACKFICLQKMNEELKDLRLLKPTKAKKKISALWADHGDYLSSQYASTNALKGDYTRYGKRSYKGMINDGILTLVRFYHGFITDYFSQIVIDFLLGNEDQDVFERYQSILDNFDPNTMKERELIHNLVAEKTIDKVTKSLQLDIIGAWWLEVNIDETNPYKVSDAFLIITNEFMIIDSVDHQVMHHIPTKSVTKIEYGFYYINVMNQKPSKNIGWKIIWMASGELKKQCIRFPLSWKISRIRNMLHLLASIYCNTSFVRKDIVTLAQVKEIGLWQNIGYKFKRWVYWG